MADQNGSMVHVRFSANDVKLSSELIINTTMIDPKDIE